MPRLADLIEAKRASLAAARVALMQAEADLNGIVSAPASGSHRYSQNDKATRTKLTVAIDRAFVARHALDEARMAALGVDANSANRSLCTNDRDDMLDATITRLERNHHGFTPSDTPDPDHATDIARAETALIERAADRGAALIERAA